MERIELPAGSLTALHVTDESVHVGVGDPLALLTSRDGGNTWDRRELPELPPATRWLSGEGPTVVDEAGGQVSTVIETPNELVVGVERTGIFVHRDGQWESRSAGIHEDVHMLYALNDSTWMATTGGGVYKTETAGNGWYHVDTGQRFQQYTYYHGLASYDGTVYVAGGAHMPGDWGAHGADSLLFRIEDDTLVEDDTPDPTEYVWCLAVVDEALFAGTVTQDLDRPGTATGRLLRRTKQGWSQVGETPAGITSICGPG